MNARKAMTKAWQAYTANAARLILGTAILLVLMVVLIMFAFLPLLGLMVFTDAAYVFASLSLFCLFVLVALGVAGVLGAGYLRFVSQAYGISYDEASKKKKVRADEKPDFMTMFKYASKEGKNAALLAYACALALAVIIGVPFLAFQATTAALVAVPFALAFMFFVMVAPPITVFEDAPPLEAWGKSFEFAVENFQQQLLLVVSMGLLFVVLAAIPVVGAAVLFALMPWFALSKIAFYQG